MHLFYDARGRLAMVDFNGPKYHDRCILQGDVIGLVDSVGAQVLRYKYGA